MAKSEDKDLVEDKEVRGQAKKPYTTPRLVRHGTLKELTYGTLVDKGPGDAASVISP